MRGIVALILLLLSSSLPAWADSSVPEIRAIRTGQQIGSHTLTHEGLTYKYRLTEFYNPHGEREVKVEHVEEHGVLPSTHLPVLWGRDLNEDGLFDAWFYCDDQGVIHSLDTPATELDGWDVIQDLLLNYHVKLKNRNVVGVYLMTLVNSVSFTLAYQNGIRTKMIDRILDLMDYQIRINRLERQDWKNPIIDVARTDIYEGWKEMSKEVEDASTKGFLYRSAADAAFVLIGSGALGEKGLVAALKLPIVGEIVGRVLVEYEFLRLSMSDLAKRSLLLLRVRELWEGAAAPTTQWIKDTTARLRLDRIKVPVAVTTARAAAKELQLSATKRVLLGIQGMRARSQFHNAIGYVIREAMVYAPHALAKQFKYITLTQGLQLAAEIENHHLWSKDPIILGERVTGDQDIMQNLSFMTVETALQTIVSSRVSNIPGRLVICGLISMLDSNVMNYAVRHSLDPSRAEADTKWEVYLGNAQTQIDLNALAYFGSLAQKTLNPSLKLVGYAIGFVDQYVGYKHYDQGRDWYMKTVNGTSSSRLDRYLKGALDPETVKIFPVYAPQ